jgi:hypothetical protein
VSHQVPVTIVAPLPSDAVEPVRAVLRELAAGPFQGSSLIFNGISTVHFARMLVLDEAIDLDGQPLAARLVFISDVDAPLDAYLKELIETCGEVLDRIFDKCEGYPAARTAAARMSFLRAHMIKPAANYVNTVGRTVEQVQHQAELWSAIEDYLDSPDCDLRSMGPLQLHAQIRSYVASQNGLRWSETAPAGPAASIRVREALHRVAVPALLLALLPLLVVGVPVWLLLLRVSELRDKPSDERPGEEHVRKLTALEDHVVQNQFSALGYVKPGLLRRATLSFILWLVDYSTRHVFNRGRLADVTTIHFARWILLDDKKRMLFVSNYDGSLESYMDDFIDKVAWGLNAVFSNGVGYPRTYWLFGGGARHEQDFKDYLRVHQLPTELWYSAYPHLSAVNIFNNAAIRDGLHAQLDEGQARQWLRRL